MKNEKIEGFYKTSDIYLVSALIANGAELVELEVNTKNILRKQILFKLNVSNLNYNKIIVKYNTNDLPVDARTYVSIFKAIKDRMFEKLNSSK